jgi:tetratricopeptide (TPR) repeat protein
MTDETRPHPSNSQDTRENRPLFPNETQPVHTNRHQAGDRRLWPWIIAVLVFLFVVLGIAGIAGYSAGLKIREETGIANAAQISKEQFDAGIEDFLAGRYELARQRIEYVLELDPDYEGASEMLGMVMMELNQPTPTVKPQFSPTPSITPDLGSLEGIFGSAQEAFSREDWDSALKYLLILRGEDPEYRLAEVNQMMAAALRDRGMEKLYRGELEQGVYDLNLAERFGPLDSQAISWRNSAAFFMFANSYFGLDWALATDYLGQICVAQIWGACYKYADAAKEYALQLIEEGDFCLASYYMGESLANRDDSALAPTATKVHRVCLTATVTPPTSTPTPTGSVTATFPYESSTPTATLSGDTATPTSTYSASATPTATFTAGPSPTSTSTPTATSTPSPTATATATLSPTP